MLRLIILSIISLVSLTSAKDPNILAEGILGYEYPNMKSYELKSWAIRQQSNIPGWFWVNGKYALGKQCGSSSYENFNAWDWAVAMQSLVDAVKATNNQTWIDEMKLVYTGLEDFYNSNVGAYSVTTAKNTDIDLDDNAQIASSFITAYETTGNTTYLNRGRSLVEFLENGWNSKHGGVDWDYSGGYIATISTTESALAALRLYRASDKNQTHIEFADKCLRWLFETLWDNSTNLLFDGYSTTSNSIDKHHYTYHMGTALSLATYLYNFTKEEYYLESAKLLADSSINRNSPIFNRDLADNYRFWYDGVNFTQLMFEGMVDYVTTITPTNLSMIHEIKRQIRYFIDVTWDPTNDGYFADPNGYQNSHLTTVIWNEATGRSEPWTADLSEYCSSSSSNRPEFRLLYEASMARCLWQAVKIAKYV
ncbi:hypothetical protein DASC09_012310 [Saccharomycopsis crataegensis]|uniref:Glycoside hydrolase family 76 protein n=1 Tax=Saccharomycopsis crataegensis TaxID=43959 RepID=A0AAV5QGR5_9ASCO|nr:hypothetical protein DASC09_012310 [Saccharomycopsis crataegensis]